MRTPSAETIKRKLRLIKGLPVKVHSWQVETGEDSMGYPSVSVWITLPDAESNWTWEKRYKIREKVKKVIIGKNEITDLWPYIYFRAASERVPEDVEED